VHPTPPPPHMFFLVSSDRFGDHLTPPGHPDRPARAHVMDAVAAQAARRGITVVPPQPATIEQLLRVHASDYVEFVTAAGGQASRLEPGTFTSPDSAEVARVAAGAAVQAVDAMLAVRQQPGARTRLSAALVMARPPGHHAERGRAMGFCIYNNVAIAAAHALAAGLDRVAIVDYDVHHGNGTQQLFYDDPRVLFVSTHQYPFYPGTGAAGDAGTGHGAGTTVNIPMEAGATDGDYEVVFERLVVPIVTAYQPQILLVSAGFDAHMRDPMARMRLSVAGLTNMAAMLRDVAARLSSPAVFLTEGGYHLRALGACLDNLVRTLADPAEQRAAPDEEHVVGQGFSLADACQDDDLLTVEDAPLIEVDVSGVTHRGPAAVDLVRAAQKTYWPTL
ncbi:MAG: histone deacetylase family protein, partial [Bacteroidales bacterium]